jgi:hypothetical protein
MFGTQKPSIFAFGDIDISLGQWFLNRLYLCHTCNFARKLFPPQCEQRRLLLDLCVVFSIMFSINWSYDELHEI